ncbi:DcaP family trimeric outer membrane transporter [Salinisphaera sp. T31B1]|uniref:DcaP family trimeric outer membrane transporter n=1 Tax=Salinisphaera sp. T31B1 TaxID=727963 RepID=UPI0033418092
MKRFNKTAPAVALGVTALVAGVNMAHAATNEELEQRIDRLEQMLRQTQAELRQSRQTAAAPSSRIEVRQQRADFIGDSAQELVGDQSKTDQGNVQARSEPAPTTPKGSFRIGDNTTLKIGGYVKMDAVYSMYSGGQTSDTDREFYLPSRVPVGNLNGPDSQSTDFNARQSRFNLTSITTLGDHKVKGFVEADFYGSKGSELTSNASGLRLRHAFIEIDDTWLLGQTWSNFMDLQVFPETLDFFTSAESVGYSRQPQIRYTHDNWSLALENPETQFDVMAGGQRATALTPEEKYPELTGDYSLPTGFGHLSVGGVLKQVSNDGVTGPGGIDYEDDSKLGYGVRLSGSVNLGDNGDEIGFSGIYGDGLGRYVGLGITPAGYVSDDGSVETISYYAGYSYLRHFWSEKWRSNLLVGTLQVDNDAERGGLATKSATSVHVNLLWNPLTPLTLGGEYAYAKREVENGLDGNMNRVQLSAKYAF